MSGEWADQPAVPDNHEIPGKTLAAAREAMGWSVEQIADQLKMAVRQVVALEAGDYATLPGPAVVRGFVRAYAKVVKLDPAPLVARIALDAPPAGAAGAARRDKPASFSEVRFPTNGKRTRLPLGAVAVVALLAAAGFGAWQFGLVPGGPAGSLPAAGSGTTVAEANGIAPPGQAAPNGKAAEAPATLGASVPLISVPPPSPATTVAPAAAAPVAPVPDPAAAPAAAPETAAPAATAPGQGANALVLSASEDSWIEVRNAGGKALFRRMVKAGETATVDIGEPATLVVGKPAAVMATLRGAPLALPPLQGSTISRVKVQ